MLLVDLDGFKQVNDSLGHDAGDQLLQAGRAALRAAITRPSDTLARLGGDEFAMLLEGANEPRPSRSPHRLLEQLSRAGRRSPAASSSLGASIGIAVHAGGPGTSEELMRHADVAMYAAKEAGRGRCEVFRHEMARELGELLGLEHELRLGLQRGEFSVHYQPEIDARRAGRSSASRRCCAGTRRPAALVLPGQFIPVAEATGLIVPLGEFVLREACEQAAELARTTACCPSRFVDLGERVRRSSSRGGGVSKLVQQRARRTPGSRRAASASR